MKLRILILFLFVEFCCFSQHEITLVYSETKEPIVGAKVGAIDTVGSIKILAVSNNQGKCILTRTGSNSIFRITAIGCDTLIFDLDDLSDSGIVELTSNTIFDEVVVTAQYKSTFASNAIQKINVISADQIEKSGSNNLADILNYQGGIRLSQDNILGSSMSLGGLSGQNVKILIDGVPVIGRQDGNIDLSQINLNNIARIEIVEGPLSVNYGTNALAGTINMITKKSIKKAFNFSLSPYYESIGNFNLSGSMGFKIKRHQFQLSGGRNYFDGWSDSDPFFQFPKSRLADSNRFKTWKPKEQYFAELRYTTALKDWQISPYLRYFKEKITNRGLPAAPYYEVGIDDYYHTERADAGLNITKDWKKAKLNSILAFNNFERMKNTYIKDLTTLENTLSSSNGAQDTAVFTLINWRLAYNQQLAKKLILEIGSDINLETAYGKRIEGLNKRQDEYAAYLTMEWEVFNKFKVKPGLRYGYNTVYKAPLTPSLNVFYKIKNLGFRLSAAKGFRAPSLKELYFDFVDVNHDIQGNQDLKSENSMNYSASVSWIKKTKANHLLKIDYTAYYNDIENLITLGLLDNSTYTYVNIGTFKSIGNQLKFDIKSKRLNLGFSGTIIGRYNRLSSSETEVDPFSFSPEIAFNGSYEIVKNRISLNSFYKFNGALNTYGLNENDELVLNKQSAYHMLDASISASFLDKKINLIVGVKNILNVKQVNVVGSTNGIHSGGGNLNAARGTSLFLSLKYQLSYAIKSKK